MQKRATSIIQYEKIPLDGKENIWSAMEIINIETNLPSPLAPGNSLGVRFAIQCDAGGQIISMSLAVAFPSFREQIILLDPELPPYERTASPNGTK